LLLSWLLRLCDCSTEATHPYYTCCQVLLACSQATEAQAQDPCSRLASRLAIAHPTSACKAHQVRWCGGLMAKRMGTNVAERAVNDVQPRACRIALPERGQAVHVYAYACCIFSKPGQVTPARAFKLGLGKCSSAVVARAVSVTLPLLPPECLHPRSALGQTTSQRLMCLSPSSAQPQVKPTLASSRVLPPCSGSCTSPSAARPAT
jgi:hypothetical protein